MSSPTREHILLTGCYRSGTTLLDKLLHNHPNVVLASQAYPVLFYYVKQQFLDQLGLNRRYPLEHLFCEQDYTQSDWHAFLDSYVLSERDIETIFDGLAAYSHGVWTPEILQLHQSISSGLFIDVLRQFNIGLYSIFPNSAAALIGTKEIMLEEYIPYLLVHEIRVVLVLRDPRAMIASVHFSDKHYMGEHRPILYSLRNWRKSVAFSLAYRNHPLFHFLRYEDLVTQLECELGKLTQKLDLSDYEESVFSDGITDQYGGQWGGNSSYGSSQGISQTSLDAYTAKLPRDVQQYIETLTFPELLTLGYSPTMITGFSEKYIQQYSDPFDTFHPLFSAEYSSCPTRLGDEINRYQLLKSSPPSASQTMEIEKAFIHQNAFLELQKAFQHE